MIDNRDGRLKPGFFVQASLPSEKEEKALFVPEAAVNYRYGVYKVFVVNAGRVSERQIRPAGQTEDQQGRRFEVAEGLKPGERVAAAISGELRDGDPGARIPRRVVAGNALKLRNTEKSRHEAS